MEHHQNLLVVGGTASGKTTLVNAILHKMAVCFPDERHIILEDTNELQTSAKNCGCFARTLPQTLVCVNCCVQPCVIALIASLWRGQGR
nr:ATPase, T2SS/T4P/T4SS family [Photobacterium leiognathi]